MIRAHSLLYAIYICLILSIICGSLLYFSNLYNQLNLHYNIREEMYVHNQSIMNFALGNKLKVEEVSIDEKSGIQGAYSVKQYGLLTLLITKSILRKDTVSSAHFVGCYSINKTAVYLANFTKSLSYSGKVKLIGDCFLPTTYIASSQINNNPNQLDINGKTSISEIQLPPIRSQFSEIYDGMNVERVVASQIKKEKDSLYFNSFYNASKEVEVNPILGNVIYKGNFILRNKDSIRIQKNTVLEDVILIAPKITIEEGFKGNIQAFATKGIEINKNVLLHYPSVICVHNTSAEESFIKIKKESKIIGAIVLFGNSFDTIDKNNVIIDEKSLVYGDIYCSGRLDLKSNVYGSVYTNRFFLQTTSSFYDNTISDIEINTSRTPNFFISIPLFESKITSYGVIKKVL